MSQSAILRFEKNQNQVLRAMHPSKKDPNALRHYRRIYSFFEKLDMLLYILFKTVIFAHKRLSCLIKLHPKNLY